MRIRAVDLDADRDALVRILEENLSGHGGSDHFEWLYRDNPDGAARAWFVLDDATGPVTIKPHFSSNIAHQSNFCFNSLAIKLQLNFTYTALYTVY